MSSENGWKGGQPDYSCTPFTMASDPPKLRRRILVKAIRDGFHTILPTPRSLFRRPDTTNEAPDVPGTSRPRGDELSTSDQLSQLSSSTLSGNNDSDSLVKAKRVAWNGLKAALGLLEKSADAFHPLKSAVGGLVTCLDLFEVGYSIRFLIVYHF